MKLNVLFRSADKCRGILVLLLVLATSVATAEEFRVETQVFSGKETTPVSETVTLFSAGRAYDFLTKPNEVTVYDKTGGRVVLLDPARKVRTEIKYEKLNDFMGTLQSWAARQPDPLLKFAADPRFEQSLDESTSTLNFSNTFMTYQLTTAKAPTESMARQYREFCDISVRLNAITNPGSIPPFPRLLVNEALAKAELIPQQVHLTIAPRQRFGGKPIQMRTEHRLINRLSEADSRRINETGELLVTFTPVSLQAYLRPTDDDAK